MLRFGAPCESGLPSQHAGGLAYASLKTRKSGSVVWVMPKRGNEEFMLANKLGHGSQDLEVDRSHFFRRMCTCRLMIVNAGITCTAQSRETAANAQGITLAPCHR